MNGENIRKQEPIQDWLDEAEVHLYEDVPEEIAEVFAGLLREVVGMPYASGWRGNPLTMAGWWARRLEWYVEKLMEVRG